MGVVTEVMRTGRRYVGFACLYVEFLLFTVSCGGSTHRLAPTDLWREGQRVFRAYQCSKCHSLDAGVSGVGPSLYRYRETMDGTTARRSILEPDERVTPGYSKGVMPRNFARRISEGEMDALIYFLTNAR